MIGVLNSMAEIGAEPVTVRNSTPSMPTAFLRSLGTSARCETSTLSARPISPPTPGLSLPVPDLSRISDMQPASSGQARCPGPVTETVVEWTPALPNSVLGAAHRVLGTAHCDFGVAHRAAHFWSDHDFRHVPSSECHRAGTFP